jgi:UDP-GlcNAc3NAcA epimerase
MAAGPLALFFGTRPQVIKASVLREALTDQGPVAAIDTGQHYDYNLHKVHYEQLGVAPPDVYLDVGSATHGQQTAAILTAAETWIAAHHPRGAVVIGDTNSTLACALAAAKARVPVAHVEAGLRAADALMAEEINRRCVDAFASILFAPGCRAEETLRRERVDGEIHRVGDVAYDVLRRALPRVPKVTDLAGYDPSWGRDYVYVTLHRAELVDDPVRLAGVVAALGALRWPVLFAAHPRTSGALQRSKVRLSPQVILREPLGYLESLAALGGARAVVTDSGGIQREAYWLGVPCVTMRTETEWVETVECGANRLLAPTEAARLPEVLAAAVAAPRDWDRTCYGEGVAAGRIAAVLAERLPAGGSSSA